ncbi:periphilin-1-like [Cavia porcellus]|uniref:periphilin-1-like n=1 Tax=Cavia porcellus TaxID=10141 RepID=UPI002FE26165
MVQKNLIENGPFLDKSIHFALSKNSPKIGVQCVEEQVKHSISEYHASIQDSERHTCGLRDNMTVKDFPEIDCHLRQSLPSDGGRTVVNIVPWQPPPLGSKGPLLKTPPLLGMKPPLLGTKSSLLGRPGEGSYNRYYSFAGYQEYDKGRTSACVQRSAPPQKADEAGNQWSRYNPSARHQSYYEDKRDSCRRQSFYSSNYSKYQSPHTKDPTFFGESLLGEKASSVSSRRCTEVQGEIYSFQKPQQRSEKRKVLYLKTSRYTVLPDSEPPTSSKVLDKPSRLTEKELDEAVRAWAAKTSVASEERKLSGISEFEVVPTRPLFSKYRVAPATDAEDSTCEDNQRSSHFKSIESKVKDIEEVYQQYSETFGMMVKKLIQKNPSLERPIQFAPSQNLQEIGDQLLKELKDYIAEYHASQHTGESS